MNCEEMESTPRPSGLKVIFLIIFLYLVGFGVIIPLLPVLSREMGASPLQIGFLMSIYSLMQFIFAPFWGRLSDRRGRRPILLLCLFGETLSYLVFAFARSIELLIVARAMAGFFGASISTASAAISDVTPPAERSKGMALIGMAFGLGFIVGPALGGILSVWAETFSSEKFFASTFTLVGVSILCGLTLLLALRVLPETRNAGTHDQEKRNRLLRLYSDLGRPTVGGLIFLFFLSSVAMSCMEATLALFTADRFGWGLKEVSFGFAYIGLLSTLNQGYLVRKVLPKWGERRVLTFGVFVLALGLGLIGFSSSVGFLAVAMTIVPFGYAFTNPAILGSVSLLTSKDEQGQIFGTTQGTSALGRIVGPALGGFVYQNVHISAPFWVSGMILSFGWLLVLRLRSRIPQAALQAGEKAESQKSSTATGWQPQLTMPIGFFQFENLVRNRVPFVLFAWNCEFNGWYSGLEQAHLKQVLRSGETLDTSLMDLKKDLSQPIVFVCERGDLSKRSAEELERQGFKNIFYVLGGYQEMKRQREQDLG